jgi:tetratricopeptide (TPR) repeat protein
MPVKEYPLLGAIDLALGQTEQALNDYAKAETAGEHTWHGHEDQDPALFAQIAEGRAGVYARLGDLQQAIDFEREATQRTPENAGRWKALGDLYDKAGQAQLAEQAHERANDLAR